MMLVDLQVHTRFSAPWSTLPGGSLTHQEAIARAKAAGLDAVCFTERMRPAGVAEALAAGREAGFPVFVGVDIPTLKGRLLFVPERADDPVFTEAAWAGREPLVSPEELAQQLAPHGAVIAVTPYHRDPNRGAMSDRVFLIQGLHAIMAVSSTSHEDLTAEDLAAEAAQARGLPVVGGSDVSDEPEQLGKAATLLRFVAATQADLCQAIRQGDVWSAQIGRAPRPEAPREFRDGPPRERRDGPPREDRGDGPPRERRDGPPRDRRDGPPRGRGPRR
jgi:hypothetical protein